jgi:hypothetical protein
MEEFTKMFMKTYLKPQTDITNYIPDCKTMYKLLLYFQSLQYRDVTIYCREDSYYMDWNAYYSKLEMNDQLQKDLNECITTHFIVVLRLTVPDFEASKLDVHANILIFNVKDHTLQRFEPHGKTVSKFEPQTCDTRLQNKFKDYTLISLYIEDEGVQTLQCLEPVQRKHHATDPTGFCGAWCLWYIDYRFSGWNKSAELTDNSPAQLLSFVTRILKSIQYCKEEKRITLRGFIRHYSHYIYNQAYKIQ